jgi:hypothetical protein
MSQNIDTYATGVEGLTSVTHPQDYEGISDAHVYAGYFAVHNRQSSTILGL